MGKSKKKAGPTLEEILQRPWCYYCEKDFDDLQILLSHQKAKHYRCHTCNRRLNTIGGLKVHMNQVHKEEIHEVDWAMPSRKEIVPGLEIFAMEGIPDDVMAAHRQKITEGYFKRQAEHRLKTGNPPPGQAQGGANGENPSKKRKITETQEQMLERLAEHRKKRAAEKAAREAGLPVSSEGENDSSEATPANGSAFSAPANMACTAQPSVSAASAYTSQMPPTPATIPGLAQPSAFTSSPSNAGLSPYTAPAPQAGFSPVGQPPFAQPPTVFSPPGIPPQAMPPMLSQTYGAPPFGQAPPTWSPNGPPAASPYAYDGRPANNDSPSFGFRPPVSSTSQRQGSGPPPNAPGMQPGLPSPAPGLPQRPSFQAPNLSKEEMAQMHTGHYNENLHNRHEPYQSQPQSIKQETSPPVAAVPTANPPATPSSGALSGQKFDAGLEAMINEESQRVQNRVSDQMYGDGIFQTSTETLTFSRLPQVDASSAGKTSATVTSSTASPAAAIPPASTAAAAGNLQPTKNSSTNIAASLPDTSSTTTTTTTSNAEIPPSNSSSLTSASLNATSSTTTTSHATGKAKKKKQDTNMRLVYSDDAVSPEEKMSSRLRYAYQRPADKTEMITGPISAGVTGPAGDTVRDPQDAHAGS